MRIDFFEEGEKKYGNADDVVKDLNLNFIARNMAHENYGDIPFILEVLQCPLTSEEKIAKRQQVVLAACENLNVISSLRKVIVKTWEDLECSVKAIHDSRGKHLMEQTVIGIQVEGIRGLINGLQSIHEILQKNRTLFETSALSVFYHSFYEEEPVEILEEQKALVLHLDSFKDKGEILLRAKIGEGFSLNDVEVLAVSGKARRISGGIFSAKRGQVVADEEVYQSSVEFTNKVILQLLEQCFPFLQRWQDCLYDMMRQIVFLTGCAKLYERGLGCGMYFCFPKREEEQAEKVYELSLALQTLTMPIYNTVSLTKYGSIIVTGANQGGKSTFLRSLGIAQVMCQAGMFVAAQTYPLHAYDDMFTHFTRREDVTMNMGKFEEELKRMGEILCGAKRNTLLLLNESFATTTEVTAFQIATDLIHACMEHEVTVWMVTHITKFAKELYEEKRPDILFLSAGRQADKEIRYQMYEKEPGDTSYGLELYEQMIEKERG